MLFSSVSDVLTHYLSDSFILNYLMKTLYLLIFFISVALASAAQSSGKASVSRQSRDSVQIKANDKILAQRVVRLSIGVEYGIPVGQAADIYGTVIGGSLKVEVPVTKSKFDITFTLGYTTYLTKLDYTGSLTDIKISQYLPVSLGGKYNFSRLFYIEGDAGISKDLTSYYSEKNIAFYYAPIVGISAATNKHKANIDISLRYDARAESGGTIGQIALRLAYKFGLN